MGVLGAQFGIFRFLPPLSCWRRTTSRFYSLRRPHRGNYREREMGGAGQAMKRIPRIKFPQRHPKPSGSASEIQESAKDADATQAFFSSLKDSSATLAGKASLQPKRMPVTNAEIEAILLGGCI